MKYLVRLTARSLRDLESIYNYVEADTSQKAFAWFNRLAKAIYSFERFPNGGPAIPESKRLRHLLLGKKPNTYRIICALDRRNHVVNVLHIRHGAPDAPSGKVRARRKPFPSHHAATSSIPRGL